MRRRVAMTEIKLTWWPPASAIPRGRRQGCDSFSMRETMVCGEPFSGDGPLRNFLDLERGRVVVAMGANERQDRGWQLRRGQGAAKAGLRSPCAAADHAEKPARLTPTVRFVWASWGCCRKDTATASVGKPERGGPRLPHFWCVS